MSVCCLSLLRVLSDSLDKSANGSISMVDEEVVSSSFGPSLEHWAYLQIRKEWGIE